MKKENEKINITIKNFGSITTEKGTDIFGILNKYKDEFKYPVLAARVNNAIRELSYKIEEDCCLEFIDITNVDGMRIYRRSLYLLLIKAADDVSPSCDLRIHHSIGNGIFCTIKKDGSNYFETDNIKKLEERMREIVKNKIPIEKNYIKREEAAENFKRTQRSDRYNIVKYRKKDYVSTYILDGYEDYFYGYMVPHTGHLDRFNIIEYKNGLVMIFPQRNNPDVLPEFLPQQKLFDIFSEYEKWGTILGAKNAGEINNMINNDSIHEFIRVSEALQEKKIANIADMINSSLSKKKIILISGPSSSGKTTFARRLSIQLKVNQLKPVTISLDDYYLDKGKIPLDEYGQPDLEALEALDVKLINEHLKMLLEGQTVTVPKFSFKTGKRETYGKKIKLNDDTVLLIGEINRI